MKLAIVGSRNGNDYWALCRALARWNPDEEIEEVISGGAVGVDTLADKWSREHLGKPAKVFAPQWKRDGKYDPNAGFARNRDIVDAADCVFALWDGLSRGTAHSVAYAVAKGKPVKVEIYDAQTGDQGSGQ